LIALQTLSFPINPERGGRVSYGPLPAPLYYTLMRQAATGTTHSSLREQGNATLPELLAASRDPVVANLQLVWLPAGSSEWNATVKDLAPFRGAHASRGGPPTLDLEK
jgi:hypothetical protein